jgi:hypothetical protein
MLICWRLRRGQHWSLRQQHEPNSTRRVVQFFGAIPAAGSGHTHGRVQ